MTATNLHSSSTDAGDRPALIPDEARAAALVSKRTACAMGDVSSSWWDERVQRGEAPQPVIRAPRFTRWRLADVAAFYARLAERGDPAGAARLAAVTAKACAAARARRAEGGAK
ncbi:hypothetical protein MOJ79_07090 [Calidifontimicrobium sp. SYSU G02091]|uniref:helix-turn-helix transcriptional regulator n=1 Tax=Calidifontimicrobium sp. SYSU G02091 TaxID=2926421 RepID=UPI001F531B44|nr:hypothetical protein [Calidifontimicrobium sp. SYSU G02091]MCI1191602.1 hypothetical protein [Calidifontimicrobium sp. SYSU G02091]